MRNLITNISMILFLLLLQFWNLFMLAYSIFNLSGDIFFKFLGIILSISINSILILSVPIIYSQINKFIKYSLIALSVSVIILLSIRGYSSLFKINNTIFIFGISLMFSFFPIIFSDFIFNKRIFLDTIYEFQILFKKRLNNNILLLNCLLYSQNYDFLKFNFDKYFNKKIDFKRISENINDFDFIIFDVTDQSIEVFSKFEQIHNQNYKILPIVDVNSNILLPDWVEKEIFIKYDTNKISELAHLIENWIHIFIKPQRF